MTPPVSGIPPHAQKAIVGRFLGFQVLAPSLPTIESSDRRDTAARLSRRLCWITNEMLEDPDSVQTMAGFLSSMPAPLRAELGSGDDTPQSAARFALKELDAVIAGYLLSPYDPLGRLTEAAARIAADYYRAFGAEVPAELWQSTFPRFSFVSAEIRLSFASAIHVQLWTEFGTDDYPTAQVMVKVAPRGLDEETIAALPRILLHEYVAHVPQGPHTGRRFHPDVGDMFAEGWMDYIAHRVFKDVLERTGPSPGLGDSLVPAWIPLHEKASEGFFKARCMVAEGDRIAANRCEGATAARQLHDLLRRLPATKGRADEYLYRLSFGLNVSRFGNVARARFAANVRLFLQRASRTDALTVPLLDWVNGLISSNDFFEQIIEH